MKSLIRTGFLKNRAARNALWIIIGKIVQSILQLIIGMLTARYLGPSNYGLISYAASLVAFVVPIMNLGFSNVLVQELTNATDMAIDMKQRGILGKPCPDYVDETVSMKVVRIIQGYVNVVNKMVWRKDQ